MTSLPPTRKNCPFLEHVQQLGLEPERHLADLVEQEGAPVGQLELARLAAMGAR